MSIETRQGQSLLEALYNEETNLAAIRGLVTARLGASPYSERIKQKYPTNTSPRLDEYRFLGMSPTDAAVEVLQEAGSVRLSLDEVVQKLEGGGLEVAGMARLVNAGLLNRAGVGKDTLGRYYYDDEILKG